MGILPAHVSLTAYDIPAEPTDDVVAKFSVASDSQTYYTAQIKFDDGFTETGTIDLQNQIHAPRDPDGSVAHHFMVSLLQGWGENFALAAQAGAVQVPNSFSKSFRVGPKDIKLPSIPLLHLGQIGGSIAYDGKLTLSGNILNGQESIAKADWVDGTFDIKFAYSRGLKLPHLEVPNVVTFDFSAGLVLTGEIKGNLDATAEIAKDGKSATFAVSKLDADLTINATLGANVGFKLFKSSNYQAGGGIKGEIKTGVELVNPFIFTYSFNPAGVTLSPSVSTKSFALKKTTGNMSLYYLLKNGKTKDIPLLST